MVKVPIRTFFWTLVLLAVAILAWQFLFRGSPDPQITKLCYADKLEINLGSRDVSNYDYRFLELYIDEEKVSGSFENYPFATDSSFGELEGEIIAFDEELSILDTLYYQNAEGMQNINELQIELLSDTARVGYGAHELGEDGIYHYGEDGVLGWWEIPQVSCNVYENLRIEKLGG